MNIKQQVELLQVRFNITEVAAYNIALKANLNIYKQDYLKRTLHYAYDKTIINM